MSTSGNRLLVLAQAIDENDALFGFFVNWIAEAATQFDQIHVIALRVGSYQLPSNVCVTPMRPRESRSKLQAAWTILSTSWIERKKYDAVYLRGDAQYVVLAGWLWRLFGKRVVLWYAHYTSRSPWLRPASWFANVVVTSVAAANTLPTALAIGQAIDASRFPVARTQQDTSSALIFGRVSPVKRVPWMLDEISHVDASKTSSVYIFGRSTDPHEANRLRESAIRSSAVWHEEDIRYADAPALYAAHDLFLNATPGSLDKTIVEAMMSGCVVVASTPGYRECLDADLAWLCPKDEDFGKVVARAMNMPRIERQAIGERLRTIALARHSQTAQIQRIKALLQ